MRESKVFEVPMLQIKMEVIDDYDGQTLWLIDTIARNVQTIIERLTGTAWWNSFDNPHDRQIEITDMAWEMESLWLNENFDDGFYNGLYGVEDRLFGSHSIDINERS